MARQRVDHARLVDELHTQLTERLEQMTTSDEWFDYLATARRFHRYSPQNQLLLALQGAEGHVAGYSTWRHIPARGGGTCQVAKGSVGLKILAPLTTRTVDVDDATGEETTTRRLRGFRTVKVFHQGQLVAPPDIGDNVLPELLTGENRWQHVWSAVSGHLEATGYTVDLHTRSAVETWNGMTSWSDRAVLVADDLEPPQRLKTLLHEWAHVELAHDTRDLARPIKEVEAESVAYLLSQSVGLDSGAYSVPYVANWARGDVEVVRTTAEQVLTTTKRLVTTIETELGIELTPDVFDHAVAEPDSVGALPKPTLAVVGEPAGASQPVQESFPTLQAAPEHPSQPTVTGENFLKAVMVDLEPDQRARLSEIVYDRNSAAEVAAIVATAGRTAAQTARLLDGLAHDAETIRDALRRPQPDAESPELFTDSEVRAALHAVASEREVELLMPAGGAREDVVRQLRDDRLDDLRLIQRAVQQNDDPGRIAALAYGLKLSPEQAIEVCASIDATPQRTMAIAIALHDGDGRAAFTDLVEVWPDVPGGWERHAHPSMQTKPRLSAVPDYNPTRQILEQWTGRSTPPAPAVQPPALP